MCNLVSYLMIWGNFFKSTSILISVNKILKYVVVLAILPLFASTLSTDYFTQVSALQVGEGTTLPRSGSDTGICGLQFCSEIPGGRDAWMAQHSFFATLDSTVVDELMVEEEEEETMTDDSAEEPVTEAALGSVLLLSRANVPVDIPLSLGYYNGDKIYYIITDSSDAVHADEITEEIGWKVEYSPLLATVPDGYASASYFIENGPITDQHQYGSYTVFSSTPAQEDYTALVVDTHVRWVDEDNSRMLTSEAEILSAIESGEMIFGDGSLGDGSIILNSPQIIWPDGQMMIKESADDPSYGGGQVTDIDTEEMTVTFIAHRGWGPDGRTIYYIVTDTTPSGPAEGMGVVYSPKSGDLLVNSAAVDLYQFTNGITGTGPLGFQPGIASGALGDDNYSPMWRIYLITWNDPTDAELLETIGDINAYSDAGLITIDLARPMASDHIVNCPFIDPFQ